LAILRSLPATTRSIVMQMLRSLDSSRPARALAETAPQYIAPTLDQEIAELIEMYPALGPLFDEAQTTLPDHAVRALITNVRIWIQEKENQQNFASTHCKLSRFFTSK